MSEPAHFKVFGWKWLNFTRATYLPPRGDGWFRWSVKIGPLDFSHVARDPWDYWMIRVGNGHAWHLGNGFQRHVDAIRRRHPV